MNRAILCAAFISIGLVSSSGASWAEAQKNPIAVFAGLDKITGTITAFEVEIGQTKRFGALNVRPRICNTRPVTEEPKTTSFVEVDENLINGKLKRIFTGWMLAESPGLNGVEHPVFDIWLTGCRNPATAPVTGEAQPEGNVLDDQSAGGSEANDEDKANDAPAAGN